ncbi:MAG TPA: SH3 domain-containing C40 family peptidase [Gemmatimonadaceae bacterium]|nr:SH3 domain-containing C40 family peptidase [Gemmatimonadaceae bacterium]
MSFDERGQGEPVAVSTVDCGVVVAAVAPMLAEPHVSSGQVSQQLARHVVSIVEDQGDWLLVRGRDEYEGWMHRGYLARGVRGGEDPGRLVSLGCVVRSGEGELRALPLRAVLAPGEAVVSGEALHAMDLTTRFPMNAQAIGQSGVELFVGTSYQWGGITPWGADCSGLVQSVFALHGVSLPRDAWQQARVGRDGGRDIMATRPADLLFFSDRPDAHVTHVAIALGDCRIVHLALGRGGYAVERLDVADDYVAKLKSRFLFARSVL